MTIFQERNYKLPFPPGHGSKLWEWYPYEGEHTFQPIPERIRGNTADKVVFDDSFFFSDYYWESRYYCPWWWSWWLDGFCWERETISIYYYDMIIYDRLIVIIVGIMRIESSSFWVSHGLSTNHAAPRAHPRARRRWNFNARQNLLYRTMVPELTRTLPRVNEQRTFEDQSKNQIPSLLLLKEWINRILLHIGKQA